jgi:diguanylate cyclase (GGDEF)-like protein
VSFRGRLALFFVLLVVIPIAAIAVLVVDVTGDSQAGKADARLSVALEVALAAYEEDVEIARAELSELIAEPGVTAALRAGDGADIEAAMRAAAGAAELEYLRVVMPDGGELAVLGGGEPFAVARVRTEAARDTYDVEGSITGHTEYAETVRERIGLTVALTDAGRPAASTTNVDGADLPAPGESHDVELGEETLRGAGAELPEPGGRVYVFTETETGGFFDSRPRAAAAVALFVLLALGFIVFVFRALQGQVSAMLAAARRIGAGDFSQRVPVVGRDEMAALASEFNQMTDRLEEQIEQLRRQRTELDRSVTRLGEAFASGLDRDALLRIVAETALAACEAELCRIGLDDGTVIEMPEGYRGEAREAVLAGAQRSARDGTQVVARRKDGHALAAPLVRVGENAGTIAVGRAGREFGQNERDVFVYLIGQASASIENIAVHERAAEQAVTDELTGLANNRAFREAIDREAARAERFGHELSLVILDVDDFKQVNDTRGHLQGDEVLRVIGRILESEPRAIDIPARYGGEEFVVGLPETGSIGAIELAERIRERLEESDVAAVDGGAPVRVTASFGTATMPDSAASLHDLFAAADEALYEAKRKGKNRVVTAPAVVRSRQ